jgi:O-antigen/teichoic acid export membrane protein
LFWYFSPEKLSAVLAAQIYVASTVMVLVIAVFTWHRQVDGDWGRVIFKDSELFNASLNLWTASSMSMAVQWSGILMAGIFVISSDIAYLSAAQRTANLASLALVVVNMVVAPRYARLWHEGNVDEMRRLAKWSTRGMLLLALPIIVIILFIPEVIMGLFGDGYEKGAILLSIMVIGQFINLATGSVGYLLNMSGHESDFRRVTFFAGPLTIILSYAFIMQWGVLGAAIATAVGLSVQNLLALYMVKKRLGFWPIG